MHSRVFCRLSAHQSGTRGGSGVVVAAALGHGGAHHAARLVAHQAHELLAGLHFHTETRQLLDERLHDARAAVHERRDAAGDGVAALGDELRGAGGLVLGPLHADLAHGPLEHLIGLLGHELQLILVVEVQAGVAGAHNEHFGLLVPVDVGRI